MWADSSNYTQKLITKTMERLIHDSLKAVSVHIAEVVLAN